MPKQQAAGLVAGESGMNRRQISPPRKLPKPMKRPITRLSKVFRINLRSLARRALKKPVPIRVVGIVLAVLEGVESGLGCSDKREEAEEIKGQHSARETP